MADDITQEDFARLNAAFNAMSGRNPLAPSPTSQPAASNITQEDFDRVNAAFGLASLPKPDQGSFSRGWDVSWKQLPQTAYQAGTLAGRAAENIFGEGGLSTGVRKLAARKAAEYDPQIEGLQRPSDSLEYSAGKIKDGDFAPLLEYLKYGGGYMGGQMVQSALAAAGGAALASTLGLPALATAGGGVLGGMVAKEATRMAVGALGKEAPQIAIESAAKALMKPAATRVAAGLGGTAALTGQNVGLEAGQISQMLEERLAKEGGRAPTGDELLKAGLFSGLSGATDTVADIAPILGMAGRLGLKPATNKVARGVGLAFANAGLQGAQENLQTRLEYEGSGTPTDTDKFRSDVLESTAMPVVPSLVAGLLGIPFMPSGKIRGPKPTVDGAANQAATSDENDLRKPTLAQIEAGNYQKAPVDVGRFNISVENPSGSIRQSKPDAEEPWTRVMNGHYGYHKGVEAIAPDGERIDAFIKDGTPQDHAGPAFIIDQTKADGTFDEPKVMHGYSSAEDALNGYLSNYPAGWKNVSGITEVPQEDLRRRLEERLGFMQVQPDAKPVTFSPGKVSTFHVEQNTGDGSYSVRVPENVAPTSQELAARAAVSALNEEMQRYSLATTGKELGTEILPSALSRPAQNMVDNIIRPLFKVDVIPVRAATPHALAMMHGARVPSAPNAVFVNTDTTPNEMFAAVTMHELTHDLQHRDPGLYVELTQALMGHTAPGGLDLFKSDYAAGTGASMDAATAVHEFNANVVGDAASRPDFWRGLRDRLETKKPGLFHRFARYVVDFLNGIIQRVSGRGFGSEKYLANVTKARDAVVDVLAKHAVKLKKAEERNAAARESHSDTMSTEGGMRPVTTPAEASQRRTELQRMEGEGGSIPSGQNAERRLVNPETQSASPIRAETPLETGSPGVATGQDSGVPQNDISRMEGEGGIAFARALQSAPIGRDNQFWNDRIALIAPVALTVNPDGSTLLRYVVADRQKLDALPDGAKMPAVVGNADILVRDGTIESVESLDLPREWANAVMTAVGETKENRGGNRDSTIAGRGPDQESSGGQETGRGIVAAPGPAAGGLREDGRGGATAAAPGMAATAGWNGADADAVSGGPDVAGELSGPGGAALSARAENGQNAVAAGAFEIAQERDLTAQLKWMADAAQTLGYGNVDELFNGDPLAFARLSGNWRDANPVGLQFSRAQTLTPEFKNWFGASKVVDKYGAPLVVYHGTENDFDVFRPTIYGDRYHFGTIAQANARIGSSAAVVKVIVANGGPEPHQVDRNIIPVYLSIKNPLRLPDLDNWVNKSSWLDARTRKQMPQKVSDMVWRASQDTDRFTFLNAVIKGLEDLGYDGIVYKNTHENWKRPADSWMAFHPNQIKSAIGNNGAFSRTDNRIQFAANNQTQTEAFKRWSNNAPIVNGAEAQTREFKSGERVVLVGFHGTQRPDRVGDVFKRSRATSGPMAFFTSDPELASSYAEGKSDTSLNYEDANYPSWFKFKPEGARSQVDIERAWYHLPENVRQEVAKVAPTLRLSEDGTRVISEEGSKRGNGSYDYNLQETQRGYDKRGNPIKALVEDWLNSGVLFDNEERFMDVLKMAGVPMNQVTYDSPKASYPFVYKTFISMQSPLVTTDIPDRVVTALGEAAKRDRSRAVEGADPWDKSSRTLKQWFELFSQPDNAYVWTSIPDKVTDVLRRLGYDGIIDGGGKGGGPRHLVYIPFQEDQVKSAIGNKGTFSHPKKIQFSLSQFGRTMWYSPMQRFIEQKGSTAMPAEWLSRLAAWQKAGNIKAEELEWSGLTDWLGAQTGKVKKDAVLAFLRGNGVRVEEVVLGEQLPKPKNSVRWINKRPGHLDNIVSMTDVKSITDPRSEYRKAVEAGTAKWVDDDGNILAPDQAAALAEEWGRYWHSINPDNEPNTEFNRPDLVLPGGENYRELLLTLPRRQGNLTNLPDGARALHLQDDTWWVSNHDGTDLSRGAFPSKDEAISAALQNINAGKFAAYKEVGADFNSGHFDQPNVLAHVRFNERTQVSYSDQERADMDRRVEIEDQIRVLDVEVKRAQKTRHADESVKLEKIRDEVRAEVAAGRMPDGGIAMAVEDRFVALPKTSLDARVNDLLKQRRALQESMPPTPKGTKKRVLFIEEIQSDWAQKGKKDGFRGLTPTQRARFEQLGNKVEDGTITDDEHDEYAELSELANDMTRERATPLAALDYKHPRAPFVTKTESWVALAMKRMIRYAAENGFDAIAWTNGEQQAERYSLSKQVRSIEWQFQDRKAGYKLVTILPADGNAIELRLNRDGAAGGVGDGRIGGEFDGKNIKDIVGKDVGQKIMSDDRGSLSGNGLNIGGEGMRAFYDRIVQNIANDVLKRLGGGRVGSVQVSAKDNRFGLERDFDPNTVHVQEDFGAFTVMDSRGSIRTFDTRKAAEDYIAGRATMEQPGFTITPELHDLAMDGMPLFARVQQASNTELPIAVKKIGERIVGAMGASEKDIADRLANMERLAKIGWNDRDWYDRSVDYIIDLFKGDRGAAERFIHILAITSSGASVKSNVTNALKALSQYQKVRPIHVATRDVDRHLNDYLYHGIMWEGTKTNDFAEQLIAAFDRKDTGRPVQDRHMIAISMGGKAGLGSYQPGKSVGAAVYEFSADMSREVARRLEIPFYHFQSAMWVGKKFEQELKELKQTIAESKNSKYKNFTQEQLEKVAYAKARTAYDDALRERGKISVDFLSGMPPLDVIKRAHMELMAEYVPSTKTAAGKRIAALPYKEKYRFHRAAEAAFPPKDFFKLFGLDATKVTFSDGKGSFEGAVSPNIVSFINAPEEMVNRVANAWVAVFQQDMVPFFKADPDATHDAGMTRGMRIEFNPNNASGEITPAQSRAIHKWLQGIDPGLDFTLSGTGVDILNFTGMEGQAFQDKMDAAIPSSPLTVTEAIHYGAQTPTPAEHDWSSGLQPTQALEAGAAGSPNIQKRLGAWAKKFAKFVENYDTGPQFSRALRRAGDTGTTEDTEFKVRPDLAESRSRIPEGFSRQVGWDTPVFQGRSPGRSAVAAVGIHYGRVANLSALDASKFGTGAPAQEIDRIPTWLKWANQRVYFYTQRKDGVLPKPEDVVTGFHIYRTVLDNLYDAENDPDGIIASWIEQKRPGGVTGLEQGILKSGYDGYLNRSLFGGSAVIIGHPSVPSEYLGFTAQAAEKVAKPEHPQFAFAFGSWLRSKAGQTVADRSNLGPLTQAQATAVEHVLGRPQTFLERAADFYDNLGKNLKQGLFDQFAPILELGATPYMLSRMSKGGDSTLEAALLYGRVSVDKDGFYDVDYTEAGGLSGFAPRMAKLKGEESRFLVWVAAQRAELLSKQGRENLFSGADIAVLKTLNQGNMLDGTPRAAIYKQGLADLTTFNNDMLKIGVDSGLIGPDAYAVMRDQPYLPFYRMIEDGTVEGFGRLTPGLVGQWFSKRLKGGTQQLHEDLLSNLLQNWSHVITASARNRAARATLAAAERVGIATQWKPGMSTKGTVYYRDNVLQNGAIVNTERRFLVSDPHLLDAITSLEYAGLGAWSKPFVAFKRYLTAGVTISPVFKIRNLIRDSIQSVASANNLSPSPLSNIGYGWAATAHTSEVRAHMLAAGGIMRFGSMLDGNSSARAQELIHQGVHPDMILDSDSKITKFFKTRILPAFEAYQEYGDRGEQVNRAALYQRLLDKGMSHGEAAFWARDLMDFSMQGKWTAVRTLTQIVPFMNARLQGLYKLGRATAQDWQRMATTVGAVSLASVALMLAYRDDDWWKKREEWDLQNYWAFKIGDLVFRIPKPFEIGAIGSLSEYGLAAMIDDEMTGRRLGDAMFGIVSNQLSMNPIPQLVKPIMDIYANKDSFTQRPIENEAMKNLRPEDRFTPSSSETARFLGSLGLPNPVDLALGSYNPISPVQIDFLARAYFGWLGTMTMVATDAAIRPLMDRGDRPAMQLRDVFLAGNFAESLPTNSSRYVTQMYQQANEIEQAYNSYRDAMKNQEPERAARIMEKEGGKIQKYRQVSHLKAAESKLHNAARQVGSDRLMSADEKRARLNELAQLRDQIARNFSPVH